MESHSVPTGIEVPLYPEIRKAESMTDYDREIFRKVASALARRRLEALSLYVALPHAKAFHADHAPERLVRGSNRAGKTLIAAVEVAFALMGTDPYNKYPKKDGRAFLIGKNGKHLGQVMYRKLFRAGAFQIIKNNHTGLFEVYQPWRKEHLDNKKHTKLAPPLIPARYVASVSWENKKEQIPNMVTMANGWEASFFSSLASHQQGSDIDLAWFDEEIMDTEWYKECSRGLMDRGGVFIWSATPQAGCEQLFDLHQQAEEQRSWETPNITEYFLSIRDNPYISEKDKQLFASKLTDEDDYNVRIKGEFAIVSFRVYPEFDMHIHGCDPFHVPDYWTRYLVVDPGRQVCACLFAAVPPPGSEHEGHIFLYDQLYMRKCSAKIFADEVFHKSRGQSFHAFIIDANEGRKAQTGSGITIEYAYSEALAKREISSYTTGNGFVWGSDDLGGGLEAIRKLLSISRKGKPILQVMRGKCTDLEYELERYRYSRKLTTAGYMLTDTPEKKNDHLIDCLRYLSVYEPEWYPARKKKSAASGWARKQLNLKKQRAMRKGPMDDSISLGPRQNAYV